MKRPFRFLSTAEFDAMDVKSKALYLVRAQQELEVQQDLLRGYRDRFAGQLAAIVELRSEDAASAA